MYEPKDVCELISVEDDAEFSTFLDTEPNGLLMLPQEYDQSDRLLLTADTGDFAKWLRSYHPEIPVSIQRADYLVLRSSDFWFPLVFLANNVGLPLYLNLVANYLYDRMKGALRNDRPRVHLSAEYKDPATGLVKRFNFEGDSETFRAEFEKIDMNQFFHD